MSTLQAKFSLEIINDIKNEIFRVILKKPRFKEK